MMKRTVLLTIAAAAMAACSDHHYQEQWTVTGTLPEAIERVRLEVPSPTGGWYVADSAATKANGEFTLHGPTALHTIYRVNIEGRYIYLPVDSTETISLQLLDSLNYEASGSEQAAMFAQVDKIIRDGGAEMQRKLLELLNGHFDSQAAYYANLRLNFGNKTLLRTVTNAYAQTRPDDLHTSLLRAKLQQANGNAKVERRETVIEMPEVSYFDIELPDRNGESRLLSTVVENNRKAVLAFVNFADENAPAIHLALGSLPAGTGIYEVGFGPNQHFWLNASEALPWINVFQSESAPQIHLGQYNVTQLPTFFIFEDGEISERTDDPTMLKEKI